MTQRARANKLSSYGLNPNKPHSRKTIEAALSGHVSVPTVEAPVLPLSIQEELPLTMPPVFEESPVVKVEDPSSVSSSEPPVGLEAVEGMIEETKDEEPSVGDQPKTSKKKPKKN